MSNEHIGILEIARQDESDLIIVQAGLTVVCIGEKSHTFDGTSVGVVDQSDKIGISIAAYIVDRVLTSTLLVKGSIVKIGTDSWTGWSRCQGCHVRTRSRFWNRGRSRLVCGGSTNRGTGRILGWRICRWRSRWTRGWSLCWGNAWNAGRSRAGRIGIVGRFNLGHDQDLSRLIQGQKLHQIGSLEELQEKGHDIKNPFWSFYREFHNDLNEVTWL